MERECIKVLLVEDNPGDARLVQEMLKEVQDTVFELEQADCLLLALKRIARKGIDVILLDLSLPDSQGLDTFNSVFAQASEVPIVILTGIADKSLAIKAVQEGAQDYLVKGEVDSSLLERSLHYAIGRKKAEQEMKELQAGLARASKIAAVGTLAGGIAHRINAPLSVIIDNVHMIEKMIEEKGSAINLEDLGRAIKIIGSASMSAKKTVSDLLLFSLEHELKMKPLKIEKVIDDSISSIKDPALQKINIIKDISPALGEIPGNSERLVRAFSNIIQNAVEAMPEGGTLKIEARKKTDEKGKEFIELNFIDNGCGIPEEKLPNVFDPFFSTKDMATGLGLSISREIVRAHRGSIEVKSKTIRKPSPETEWYKMDETHRGTTVTIRLPVSK